MTDTPETAVTTETAEPNLDVRELYLIAKALDYAADQGAFKGWGIITQVFQLRQNLVTFIKAVAPNIEEEMAKAAEPANTETPVEAQA